MSSLGLFGGAPRRAAIANVDGTFMVEFDASVTETHTISAQATQHPVEEGSDISDHIRRKPDELSVNVIMTNHPPILLASSRAKPITGFSDPKTRAEDTFVFLSGLVGSDQLVKFTTTFKNYTNMTVLSAVARRDAPNGNIANVEMVLREIIIATTETREAPQPAQTTRQQKTNIGKKTKTTPSKPVQEKSTSILSKILG